MPRIIIVASLVIMLCACAAKTAPVDYHGYAPETPMGKYYELMSFKDDPEFHTRGFADATDYQVWREYCIVKRKSASVSDQDKDRYRLILMLGNLYYQNKGQETPMTNTLRHMVLQNKVTIDVPAPPITDKK